MRNDYGRGERLPPAPKPYRFVPFPAERGDQRSPRDQDVGGRHDRYAAGRLTGRIEGFILALSPVHVASGNIEVVDRDPPLVRGHFRCGDRPAVPGSSLKGAVRSIVEAISNPPSCVRVTRTPSNMLPRSGSSCRDKDRLCLACRLFGALGYLGRVRFHDAELTEGETRIIKIPSMFQPRHGSPAYVQNGQIKGRKFYRHGLENGQTAGGNVPVEVCPRGSRFRLQVDFESLSRDELGLLMAALGQGEPPLFPKLGGGKPACCGSVRVEIASVTTFPTGALEFDAEPVSEDVAALAGSAGLVHAANRTTLAEILRFPGEDPCPDRNY
jgi:CRISPR-associated protein Csm3